jgi:hypothetical protein
MFRIVESDQVPNQEYFTAADVEPKFQPETPVSHDAVITILNGKGKRRNQYQTGVTSTVVYKGRSLCAIHVGWHHKHRGGQQWYFYYAYGRVAWKHLPDRLRREVRKRLKRAPEWARSPGKLSTERLGPDRSVMLAYKVVRYAGGEMASLYDPSVKYVLGERNTQAVKPGQRGGFYAYPTAEQAYNLIRSNDIVDIHRSIGDSVAVIEVELSGRRIYYNQGFKIAATHIRPLRILDRYTCVQLGGGPIPVYVWEKVQGGQVELYYPTD